ncbi:hypothetical protein UVI_02015930 [Ustilaginoidea virens]|uniref:Uncharacterized protein n=1 Tax=Ustilaginoidea virens TaxID=1159556 RepID=A0A1B5KRU3_USTVR|nr:hypothetical protein UVI_02015930 [Ustilaginoidea virens]
MTLLYSKIHARRLACLLLAVAYCVAVLHHYLAWRPGFTRTRASRHAPASSWPKPDNITVSGLVFYGRRDRVRTMLCYLEVRAPTRGPFCCAFPVGQKPHGAEILLRVGLCVGGGGM